jgi:hypothetical protein
MSAINKAMALLLISLLLGIVWYTFYDSSFACYDGRNPPLFALGSPQDRIQTGVTEEGYPITCDGKIHPDGGCSLLFSGLCMANRSVK